MVSTEEFLARVAHPGTSGASRLLTAMTRQSTLTPECAETPRLDGEIALVTGGNAGIGLHIAQGLSMRGAEVVLAARNCGRRAALRIISPPRYAGCKSCRLTCRIAAVSRAAAMNWNTCSRVARYGVSYRAPAFGHGGSPCPRKATRSHSRRTCSVTSR
jgi:hypothetical protein